MSQRGDEHNQEDTETRLPNPQQREHNSPGNKRRELFFFQHLILGELPRLFSQPAELRAACTGLSPLPQLQQHTPHPPDWPCHTTARQKPMRLATNGLGRHAGTLTLTPNFPRLTITLGGWGLLLEIALATMTQRATTTPPDPFFPGHAGTMYSSASSSRDKIDPLNGRSSSRGLQIGLALEGLLAKSQTDALHKKAFYVLEVNP